MHWTRRRKLHFTSVDFLSHVRLLFCCW